MINLRKWGLALVLALGLGGGVAYAAGQFTPGLPAAPSPSTGLEQVPMDTQLPNGAQPQSAYFTLNQLKGFQVIALTNSTPSTTSLSATTSALYTLTLTDNALIGAPTVSAGVPYAVQVTQDGTGGHTVTWDGAMKFVGGTSTVTSTAGRISVAECYYNGSIHICNLLANITP